MNWPAICAWATVALAIPTAGYIILVLTWWLLDRVRDVLHHARVVEAKRQGWTQPKLTANWAVLNGDDVRLVGVTGIEMTPDPGVPISEWARHAKETQRKVEVAWLKGIDRGLMAHELEAD